MFRPLSQSIKDLTKAFADGRVSPVDLVEESFARIEATDDVLHAYVRTMRSEALAQAKESAAAYQDGTAGPLEGIPMSIKDSFHVEGQISRSRLLVVLRQLRNEDSGTVRRLREAGAVFVGKTNMAEFGQSATTDNRLGPDTTNPWDITRTPGRIERRRSCLGRIGLGGSCARSRWRRVHPNSRGVHGTGWLKPTRGRVIDEGGFAAMSDFISAGADGVARRRCAADLRRSRH